MNAFRHSGATAVEIEIEYAASELRLFVQDDGRGIDPQIARTGTDGHWGIAGMNERAAQIGGRLTIRQPRGLQERPPRSNCAPRDVPPSLDGVTHERPAADSRTQRGRSSRFCAKESRPSSTASRT